MRQTIFTPTYNRADTLPRLYESIKNQIFKDFCWLIIDDGSKDNTKDVVNAFISEGIIQIKYFQKDNGGKHTAQRMAYEIATSPYITEVDSDDAILPTTIEDFENAWIEIEREGNSIAKVSMFTSSEKGEIRGFGNYVMPKDIPYIDATWHEYVLKTGNHREMVSSLSVAKFKECINYDAYSVTNKKPMKFLGEGILWSAIGKKYPTRILNKFGLIVYLDAENSILRGEQNYFNNMINSIFFLDENIQYFWWNPIYFVGIERNLSFSAVKAKINLFQMIGYMKNIKQKLFCSIFYIPFYLIAKIK